MQILDRRVMLGDGGSKHEPVAPQHPATVLEVEPGKNGAGDVVHVLLPMRGGGPQNGEEIGPQAGIAAASSASGPSDEAALLATLRRGAPWSRAGLEALVNSLMPDASVTLDGVPGITGDSVDVEVFTHALFQTQLPQACSM